MEGTRPYKGDGSKVVRTWAMTCDPHDLVGTAIGVNGLLGTSLDVQLTIETLDGGSTSDNCARLRRFT